MRQPPITELVNASTLYANAVLKLATQEGTLRERLVDAYKEANLVFAVPCGKDRARVPDQIQHAIWRLHELLTQRPAYEGESTTTASVQLMSPQELQDATRELIDIADRLSCAVAVSPDRRAKRTSSA